MPKPEQMRNHAGSYKPENLMAAHISPLLSEEVKVTLKVSQNLHASAWPGILGAVVKKDNKDSFQSGFDVERDFLTKAGLDLAGASQGDGAGGAEAGVYTPDFMVTYLQYMSNRPDFPVFFKALPILGRDGTLHNIQTQSPAAGHVFAKTGTYGDLDQLNRKVMLTARGLAGYITSARGEHLLFAAYVNRVSLGWIRMKSHALPARRSERSPPPRTNNRTIVNRQRAKTPNDYLLRSSAPPLLRWPFGALAVRWEF